MDNNQNFTLIDGTFSAIDAEQVLTTLLNYKIDYHNREDFSNHIRFNKSLEHSKKRIQELTDTKIEIIKLLSDFKSDEVKIKLKSTISIQIEK